MKDRAPAPASREPARRRHSGFGASATSAFPRLAAVYAELDRRLEELVSAHPGTSCRKCGRCCTFPPGAPVLYATALEHAYLAAASPVGGGRFPGACPYFKRGSRRCTARALRTVGCRTYFCDEAMPSKAAREAAQDLCEWALAEVRRLTEELGLEWDYGSVIDRL